MCSLLVGEPPQNMQVSWIGAMVRTMKDQDQYSDAETVRRMEDGLRRALTTPHKPNAKLKAKRKRKASPEKR
jgi:hypothetical protein